MTGFARFFLFLVIAAPAAFIAASYYNNEDPLETVKELVNVESSETTKKTTETTASSDKLENALEEIEELKKENEQLKSELKDAELTIKKLRQ